MILAGNGSDEILAIVMRTYLGPGDILAYPDPTYSLYPVLAEEGENRVRTVAWEANWELPIDALLATGARAIFFANPNAPTGTLVKKSRVRDLALAFDGLLLVDEAYVDFADESCLDLVRELPNVVLCRTFSKGYSLAGLRFGYAIAAPAAVAEMMKVKDSYNCDAISILAATAALETRTTPDGRGKPFAPSAPVCRASLASAATRSSRRRPISYSPAAPGGNAAEIYRALKARGILVRFFDKPGSTTSCASPSARPNRTTPSSRRCPARNHEATARQEDSAPAPNPERREPARPDLTTTRLAKTDILADAAETRPSRKPRSNASCPSRKSTSSPSRSGPALRRGSPPLRSPRRKRRTRTWARGPRARRPRRRPPAGRAQPAPGGRHRLPVPAGVAERARLCFKKVRSA
jgi:histidinol-phosphate/aromatic aminotransferase/cobyric acid decarboxylase-like protein